MVIPAQDRVYKDSIDNCEAFWAEHASRLVWHKQPQQTLRTGIKQLADGTTHSNWSWFPGGQLSTSYNCIHRHVKAGNGDNVAIIWDSPVTNTKQKITYAELLDEVEILAGAMREEGVQKGDVVLIYMPMIPAALFAMLATLHLGAIHAVVFGGFAASALAQRIESAKPKIIMTASCAVEGTKGVLFYRPFVEGAIEKSSHKPLKTFVWQRDQKRWDPVHKDQGQRNWQRVVKSAKNRGVRAQPVPVDSNDGIYIIYTSGTTGLPKGVLREAAGHAVGLNFSIKYLFDIKGPGDVMFCASDIGWVVGHSYIVYAPLLAGATTVLFEGKPVGTPNAGTFWRIISEHKVTSTFTAPTALRAIRKDDPDSSFLKKAGERGDLKHWRALFVAGERSEPSIVSLYQGLLEKYAAPGAQVVDNWWSSESGSPMTGIALRPELGLTALTKKDSANLRTQPLKVKPGSAGKPMPGFDIRIVDDDGEELSKRGVMGNIVLSIPLAPTGFTTLFNDPIRFYKGYMKRFDGKWIDTGDAGMIDEDGYIHIMSRSDDVINVAAHRFSTGSLEQILLSHPAITEAVVVPIPDHIKGHLPFAFVVTVPSYNATTSSRHPLLEPLNSLLTTQLSPTARLGNLISTPSTSKSIIPKTRSGKTLRRVLKELLERAVGGESETEFWKVVNVPATVEDEGAVERAGIAIREWWQAQNGKSQGTSGEKAKL